MGIDETKRHRESSFGPPSEIIRSNDFATDAASSVKNITKEVAALWKKTKKPIKDRMKVQLSLDDLQEQTEQMMDDENLRNVLAQRYTSFATKRKEHDPVLSLPAPDSAEGRLVLSLDQNPLTHWPPSNQALYYFRKNRKTEENAFATPRLSDSTLSLKPSGALITISYYSRLTKASNRNDVWVQGFVLDATYAFLSTQTLRNVQDAFPCPARTIPQERWEGGQFAGYQPETSTEDGLSGGLVMEKCAYGDGKSPWARQMVEMSKNSKSPDPIQETRILQESSLGDLDLRIQTPYWIIHQGNCSHCWVVEGIRLANDTDPRSGYPIGLYLSKQPHPTCHHCGRNPVTLAVNGDARLGESPSRICEPCWKIMGPPQNNAQNKDDAVIVVPSTR